MDDQAEPTAPRRRWRWSGWRLGTVAVALVSGGLFVVSAQSSEGTDLRPGRYDDLAAITDSEADRAAALQDRVAELTQQVRGLTDDVDDADVRSNQRAVRQLEGQIGRASCRERV